MGDLERLVQLTADLAGSVQSLTGSTGDLVATTKILTRMVHGLADRVDRLETLLATTTTTTED